MAFCGGWGLWSLLNALFNAAAVIVKRKFLYLYNTTALVMRIARGVIDQAKPVLVAISGGADSVALLHVLVRSGYDCVAAHCNFHLRGSESDSDEAFVRKFCEALSVPLHVAQFDTKEFAQQKHVSIEMAARDLRYDWFFSLLDELNIPVVAVAHHADDAAETFFLNLTRGTGVRGLAGMKTLQGRVVRPLLSVSRHEIELYCKANGLVYVTDCTNNSDDYARNRIRHHVIPELKKLNPSFLTTMGNNMNHVAQILAIFEEQVAMFRKRYVSETQSGLFVDIAGFENLQNPEPFIYEVLQPYGLSPKMIHSVARSVAEANWGRVFFSSSHRIVVDRSGIIVQSKGTISDSEERVLVASLPVNLPQPISASLKIFDKSEGFAPSRDPMIMHLDADKVTLPLVFRHWQKGDTFRPLGLRGQKKLSDFFTDAKMSQIEKESAWIVESNGVIVCVLGRRMDDRFKLTPSSSRIMEISVHKQ